MAAPGLLVLLLLAVTAATDATDYMQDCVCVCLRVSVRLPHCAEKVSSGQPSDVSDAAGLTRPMQASNPSTHTHNDGSFVDHIALSANTYTDPFILSQGRKVSPISVAPAGQHRRTFPMVDTLSVWQNKLAK